MWKLPSRLSLGLFIITSCAIDPKSHDGKFWALGKPMRPWEEAPPFQPASHPSTGYNPYAYHPESVSANTGNQPGTLVYNGVVPVMRPYLVLDGYAPVYQWVQHDSTQFNHQLTVPNSFPHQSREEKHLRPSFQPLDKCGTSSESGSRNRMEKTAPRPAMAMESLRGGQPPTVLPKPRVDQGVLASVEKNGDVKAKWIPQTTQNSAVRPPVLASESNLSGTTTKEEYLQKKVLIHGTLSSTSSVDPSFKSELIKSPQTKVSKEAQVPLSPKILSSGITQENINNQGDKAPVSIHNSEEIRKKKLVSTSHKAPAANSDVSAQANSSSGEDKTKKSFLRILKSDDRQIPGKKLEKIEVASKADNIDGSGPARMESFSKPLSYKSSSEGEWKIVEKRIKGKGTQRSSDIGLQVPFEQGPNSKNPKINLPKGLPTNTKNAETTEGDFTTSANNQSSGGNKKSLPESLEQNDLESHPNENPSSKEKIEHSSVFPSNKEIDKTSEVIEESDTNESRSHENQAPVIHENMSKKERKESSMKNKKKKKNKGKAVGKKLPDKQTKSDLENDSWYSSDPSPILQEEQAKANELPQEAMKMTSKHDKFSPIEKNDNFNHATQSSLKAHENTGSRDPEACIVEMFKHLLNLRDKTSLFMEGRPSIDSASNFIKVPEQVLKRYWKKEDIKNWKQNGLNVNVMHAILRHLKFTQNTISHIGLEPLNEKLTGVLLLYHLGVPNSMRITFSYLKRQVGEFEAFRRMDTLANQLHQTFLLTSLQVAKKMSAQAISRKVSNALAELHTDHYGTKIYKLYHMEGLSSVEKGEIQNILISFCGENEYLKRSSPHIFFFLQPKLFKLLGNSNYQKVLESRNLIEALESNGISLNIILTITFILGLEEENWLESIDRSSANYMAKVLYNLMIPQSMEYLPWRETPERHWLINHYKDKYSINFNDFISKLSHLESDSEENSLSVDSEDASSLENFHEELNKIEPTRSNLV